jgi:hypothetical protein
MEPASLPVVGRFSNHAGERLRILGEIPVRKFKSSRHAPREGVRHAERDGYDGQPLDPDGKPDTSFLAKIPANIPWTFQTIDKDGMVLNMALTWHQIPPAKSATTAAGATPQPAANSV